MESKGYILIDVPVYHRFWPDIDLIVAVMEHVRLTWRAMDPRVSPGWERVLLAGVTSHSGGPTPLLAIHVPPNSPHQELRWLELQEVVDAWCDGKSDDELRALGRATAAPTWTELLASGVHPVSQGES